MMDKDWGDAHLKRTVPWPVTSGTGRQMTLKEKAHAAMDRWAREAPMDGLKEVEILHMYDYILFLEAGGADEN